MSDHGEPRFDIQMRCMCAPFSTTRSQTCTSGFKVSVTVLRLGNRPYITIFPQKHTYKVIFLSHPGTLLFTHMAISIHEHNHITTQTPQVYASVRTYLMSSLSFLFSLPLFMTMSLTIIFLDKSNLASCIYSFPDEAAALSLSSLSPSSTSNHPSSTSAHLRSFSIVHTLFWCAATPVKFVVQAVSLYLSHFTHIVSRHTGTCIILHMHITRYHIFPITYWHVHENYPSVSSGHKSYYTVHAHTNKVIVLKSKRLKFFKWLIKTIIITPQVRRNPPPKHHHTGPHMAQTF